MDTRYRIMKVPCQTNMKYIVKMIFFIILIETLFYTIQNKTCTS